MFISKKALQEIIDRLEELEAAVGYVAAGNSVSYVQTRIRERNYLARLRSGSMFPSDTKLKAALDTGCAAEVKAEQCMKAHQFDMLPKQCREGHKRTKK